MRLALPTLRSACWLGSCLVLCVLVASRGTCAQDSPASEGAQSPDVTAIAATQRQDSFTVEQLEFFEKRVRPVLSARCLACHGPDKQESGLRVDSRAGLLAGGDSGPAVVPGDLESGYFVDAIRYGEIYQMPKDGKLPQEQIDDLVAWVKMGAPWPAEEAPAGSPSPKEPFDLAKRAEHWSLQPLHAVQTPRVRNAAWCRTWIDEFVLARLEHAGLTPSAEVDKLRWLRRVTYDLVGLPPTPEETESFLADDSTKAYERIVDRLLDSPRYGERWARHWLDLVRYADTAGHEFDYDMPLAYEYRDYVIRALNADVPYDQFVREHIAGDLLPEPRITPDGINESLVGTGFWWLGEGKHSPVDIRAEEADRIDNQLDVFGKTFLGLTVACARCHDHKFDAISARDYYALAGYLQSSRYHEATIDDAATRSAAVAKLVDLSSQRNVALTRQFSASMGRDELSRLLLAAQAATHPIIMVADPNLAITPVTDDDIRFWQAAKLEPAEVENWAKAVAWYDVDRGALLRLRGELQRAQRETDHPLHAWAKVAIAASPKNAVSPDAADNFATRWQSFLKQVERSARDSATETRPATERNGMEREGIELYASFAAGVPDAWFVTDEAFGPESATSPTGDWNADSPPRALPANVVHSGRLSRKLQGTLRSPMFEIRSPKIFYRMAGRETKLNLIIAGFQRIRDPIYGGLTINLNADELREYGQDVSKWIGQRAYVEVVDAGDGWAALESIWFGERPPRDRAMSPISVAVAARELHSARELAATLAEQLCSGDTPADLCWLANSGLVEWNAWPEAGNGTSTETVQQLADLNVQFETAEAQIQYGRRAMAMIDGSGVNEYVFIRGNPKARGETVPRRFLEAYDGASPPDESGSGRLALAERMLNESGSLLARVMVNRVWQHHFGEGLAATSDNLGRLGEAPSDAELLERLATEFVRGGWKLKPLHRTMVLSATYRQESAERPDAAQVDPKNALWHRMPVQRLEAEAIRDAILAVSERLDAEAMYGPGVPPHLTVFMQGRGRPGNSGPLDGNGRRSIYLQVRRNFLSPFLTAFDFPTPFTTIGNRSQANVPAQSLALMNDAFVLEESRRWAKLMLAKYPLAASANEATADATRAARLKAMYLAAYCREPREEELATFREFLRGAAAQDEAAAWADVAHALLNVKEFIFVR